MKKLALVVLGLFLLTTGCATEDTFVQSEAAISDLGYTNIEYQGYAWYGCDSKSDYYALKYTAISAKGRSVTLVACSAPFKGVTVRTLN